MANKYSWYTDDENRESTWSQQRGDLRTTVSENLTSRVNTWLQNHNNYVANYENRYKNRKYTYEDSYVKDSASWLDTVSKWKSNFDAEADSILAYMDRFEGYLDEDLAKSVRETLTGARGQQAAILDTTAKDNEWWSNFADENEYQTAVRYDGYNKKYSGQKYDTIQEALSTLESGEEKDWLSYYQFDLYQKDGEYASKSLSGLKSFEAQKVAEKEKEESKTWWDRTLEAYAYSSDANMPGSHFAHVTHAYRDDTSYREPSDQWSEGQRRQFGYLYADDPKKAYAYAEELNNYYNAVEHSAKQQEIVDSATSNFWSGAGHTLGAIATAPMGLADYLGDLAESVGRGTITQKSHITPFEYGQTVQSGISNKLNEMSGTMDDDTFIFGGKGLGDLYGLGVSTINSMTSALTLGGTGTLINFMGQGGAAGVDNALSRGATTDQALLYGTILGSLEGLTESIPAGDLIKIGSSATFKNLLKQTAKQGFEELVEEGTSSFFGNLADDWIMKDKSNFNIMVKELMEENPKMTQEEAEKKVFWMMANDVAFDAVGGFASGAANAFTVGGTKTMIDSRKGSKVNQQAIKQYGEYTGELVKEGLESDPKSESYQLAQKYQQQMQGTEKKEGKDLTGFQIRNLVAANEAQFAVEDFKEARNQAKDRLKELGENNTQIWPIAEIIAKKATGQELTRKEKSTLARSNFGAQVAKEMTTPADEAKSGTNGYNITYKSITERVGEEGRYGVAESGQTTLRASEDTEAEAIQIQEVTKITDGEMYVKLEDGREVYAGDIDFASGDESMLYSTIADMENMTPAAATALVKNYDASSKQSVAEYVNGVDEAYTYGYNGYSVADMKSGDYAPGITSQQMMSAYELGKQARKLSNEAFDAPRVQMRTAAQAAITKKQANQKLKAQFASGDAEVYFEDGGKVVKFDEAGIQLDESSEAGKRKLAAVNTAKFLTKLGIGGKYYFYESYENADGVRVYKDANGNEVTAPNGIFKASDGSVHIDLNAGNKGEGTALFTMGHELTHFVKSQSASQFKRLGDLVTEAYSNSGKSMHQRVLEKQAMLSKLRGEKVSYDEAFEEVVADAMSTMFTDGDIYTKLTELKTKDRGLWNTIKKFFNDLIAKFRKVYEELTPDQQDAQDIRAMKEMFDKIQDAFAEALVEASENFQSAQNSTEAIENSGGTAYSNRGYQKVFFKENVFPPFNESHSEAHELAERWSRSESTETGDRKLISYHKRWYLIEAFDDMKYGYQIMKKLTKQEYEKEALYYGTIAGYQSLQSASSENAALLREVRGAARGGYRSDSYASQHRGADHSIHGMDAAQNSRGHTNSNSTGDLPSSGQDSQGKNRSAVKLSDRDSNGNRLSKEQQEYFKDSTARDENGRLMIVYHGTRNADFTVFKRNVNFFTDSKEMADSYSPNGDMYEGYVNITKPYEIDATGEKWSKIPIDAATKKFLEEYGASVFKEGGKWRTTSADLASAIEEAVDNGDMDYDGIIIRNIDDTGSYYKGKSSNVATDYIVFNSNQFKKADNKEPSSNSDIRYSVRENATYAEIREEQQKLYQHERDLMERKRKAENNPELLKAMDDFSDLFSEVKGLLSKKRAGTATQAELDRIAEIKTLREECLQRIADIQENIGLNAMSKEAEEIRATKEALRVASDEAWAKEGAAKENKAIEKAGIPAPEYFRKKALRSFKTTTNFNEAGYLLPDGKMLNFSGGERNHRYRDHREIGEIYEATQGTAALNRFLNDGNIRIMAESPGIDLASGVEPTKEQYAAIKRFVNANGVKDGQFFVDFSDADGHRAGNYSYTGYVNADRVVNDIKYYFENGKVREQSVVSQFRNSDRDYMAAVDHGDMETAQRMVDEAAEKAFPDSVLRDDNGKLIKMYHGSSAKFNVFRGKEIGGIGNYFSPWKSFAAGYGETRAFYLNLTDPAVYDYDWNQVNGVQEDKADGIIYVPEDMEGGIDQNSVGDTEVVVYDANNIKSADPVTYDDSGKVIPLSERFKLENDDIRYSERDSDGKQLSKEQQEFFNDSVVRDEYGNLKVMYHGTSKGGFTVFDTYKSKYGLFGTGFYFTDSKNIGESYTKKGKGNNPQVYEAYLNIKNPMDMDAQADPIKWAEAFDEVDFPESGTNEEFYRALEEYYADQYISKWEVEDIIRESIEYGMGHDGITHMGGGRVNADGERHRVYIAFEAEQIKSVTNTTPTSDPDIRYSDRDYVAYDRTAILKESKVDEYLCDYAAKSSPKYAQAYIAYMRPRTFLKMTTDDMFEWYHIADQAGELDEERLSNSRPGIYLRIDHETGKVTGHEGRHRMSAMDGAGIELVPVLLLDTSNKMTKTDIAEIWLHGQFDETAMGIVKDLIPLNYENRDRVIKNFATQSSTQRIGERYGFNKTLRFSERLPDAVSNRSLLANAFEGITMSSIEYSMIQEYKSHIAELNKLETRLHQLNEEIRRIRFTEGARDAQRLQKLESEAKDIAKEINKHDKRLLNLETAEPLRRVIDQERKKQAQKTMDHVKEIQQSKKLRTEQTLLRHQIRKAVRDLDKYLNRGNKKQNVKEDLQPVVSKALKAADILFTDNYGSYDMLRNGIGTDLSDAEEALVKTCAQMLKDIDRMPSDGYDSFKARQEAESRLTAKMSKLKDVFARERKRLNNTTVSSILGELAEAYASLANSQQSYVQGAYTEAVHNFLKELQNDVGGTIVRDMTKSQLESVYAAYQMVLNTVRNANKMFNEGLKQSREQLGNAVIHEVMNAGGTHGLWTKGEITRNQASWNNTKPIWVANRIGSDTFGRLMDGLFKGQYNFAVDVDEAKQFKLEMDKKYHPRNWDAEKLYSFESSTGRKFNLNLQQIMSLYALSKREQSYSHILNGGFVFEANSTVIVDKNGIKRTYLHDGATSYKLNEVTLNEIVSSLSAEQKAYVDEMQKYLSEVMGEKGNEVSMKLYGIRLFKEKFYFPLRSSGAYMEKAKEAEMKKQQGQINLVNSGFTHAVKPEAKNPVILSGFLDVWSEHCNEMSMYHSMVLPMEDFRKVYNYSTVHDDKFDSASVFQTIQDAYGKAATDYIDQLYRELNAGATVDPRETAFKARISKFKKAAVMLSASVVVQQFSSIGRAYAVIDPKYFVGMKVKSTDMKAADEMKKYAPVAIIKEMGGFDTGTKGSAKSYIMAEQYGKGEWLKGLVKDEQYRGDIMGFAPAKADEITWCAIWEAAKRETKAKHSGMDVKSDAFLKLAGERFSEIIEKTQVYDSVLARSANMRSKSGLMQMATAFMAEPTTTINLLEDALRGRSVASIARAFGAVAVSIILNNALSAAVYAMRDDDDDETFIEKYFESFASGMVDDINPMTYYPFLKDVYSLFQGYDVERADMSVIADLRDAMKKAMTVIGKDTSDMSEEELAEHHRNVNGVLMSLLDAGCSALGIPMKNVRRDANGVINAYQTVKKDLSGERQTTWTSFWDKVGAAVKDTIPVYAWTKDKPKADKLYDVIMSGDKAYLGRIKATYKTEDAYHSAVRTALRENDARIHEAALAQINGDPSKRVQIAKQIIADGFDLDDVITAINSEISKLTDSGEDAAKKVKGYYKVEDFVREAANGDTAVLGEIREDILNTAVANGKTPDKAEEDFVSNVKRKTKDAYFTDGLSDSTAEKLLTEYVGMDEAEAAELVGYWAFCKEYPEYELSMANVDKYHEFAEPAEIPLDIFAQYINGTKGIETKYDSWGDVELTAREQVLAVIDSLDLTWQQKDALYLAHGYAESKIWDVPW